MNATKKTSSSPVFLKTEKEMENFISKHPETVIVDAFYRQLKELFFIDNNSFIGKDKEETYLTEDFKTYCKKKENDFTYVYFPWNYHLTKTVKQDDYFKLKTNRNQDLITKSEQKKLRDIKVGVFGMSVGSNIAFVLTQSGISNTITIADFDELDTTNLNRIIAGIHQIGLNKTIVAARRIYEDNPFANVVTMQNGISKDNLEILLKNKEIDLIVEEIDDIRIKIDIRNLAIKYNIPVVMVTDNGDGAVLHIERYDLGHKNIFHKPTSYWKEILEKNPKKISKETAGNIIANDIVGGIDKVDPKMVASVMRVLKKELVSWSQLGSAAILGAVMATVAVKHIILGINKELDVRAYINPDKLF